MKSLAHHVVACLMLIALLMPAEAFGQSPTALQRIEASTESKLEKTTDSFGVKLGFAVVKAERAIRKELALSSPNRAKMQAALDTAEAKMRMVVEKLNASLEKNLAGANRSIDKHVGKYPQDAAGGQALKSRLSDTVALWKELMPVGLQNSMDRLRRIAAGEDPDAEDDG